MKLLTAFKGDYVEAEKLQREAMRIRKKTVGDDHPLYASDLNNLSQLLQDQVRAKIPSVLKPRCLDFDSAGEVR